jgi:DNA-binding NtrC family response regulator
VPVDLRVIAATNKSLVRLVKKRKFREDLYYRVNVVRIALPPLRDRTEDIALLAAHFTQKYAKPGEPPLSISSDAMAALLNYSWPGNVRELENAIERACVIARQRAIEPADLPTEVTDGSPSRDPFKLDLSKPLPDVLHEVTAWVEKRYVHKALLKTQGSVSECAELCGMSRRSLTSKIAAYGIDRKQFKKMTK